MASRSRDLFLTVRSEGAILPPDFLERVVSGDGELDGLTPEHYHLARGEKLNEVISRSWNRLLGAWVSFRNGIEHLPEADVGTSITRERWLQPLFQELGYGRLLTAKALEVAGKPYPISHRWNRTPIHLLGCRVDLDRPTPRLAGASRSSPHSLVQEALNRSREFVWGFLSNGLLLRILRDNASLTRQAYVEFDLEAMMLGENYADFVLLWLLCHQSRVEAEDPHDCWLEKWSQTSKERGVRALEQLRQGVEKAITALGRGFLSYPSNRVLRDRLRSGSLNTQDYYRQLLRLVYRFLFLFSAEDRGLLLSPGDQNAAARERFLAYYSTARLRRLAERRTGTRHTDLYTMVRLVMGRLGTDVGYPELALPALGSFLFSPSATADLDSCELANLDLCDAIRALAVTIANGVRRPVDYKNLGPEELGSVYESLLELHPRVNLDAAGFELGLASGHERKTTGSYYTPTSLVDCLLNSALDPVLDQAAKQTEPAQAILRLKVIDPACGSGHFLIAAAHRIAKRLALVRTGDDEPSPEAIQTALRDVIGHCIYGLDMNPMAVELCKVNLWMDALQPGKPLTFLEHRIQCGNALFGTTPALMNGGIPDEAFTPLEGDQKDACTKWKKVNKLERKSRQERQDRIAFDAPWMNIGKLTEELVALDCLGDQSIESIREKERLYEEAVHSGDYLDGKFLADAWCAAFVWTKDSTLDYPITEDVYRQIERNPSAFYHDKRRMAEQIRLLAEQYQFFHWHLCFPDVFRPAVDVVALENKDTGWNGGFDVVLGNPPWERIKLQEKEWFASRHPEIAEAPNAATRHKMIVALEKSDPALFKAFRNDSRIADGESHLIRNSGRFPLCGKGDINTYAIFAEINRSLLNRPGRVGCIVPSGIATDNTTKEFFAALIESNTLASLYDFENAVGLFEGVGHGRFKFCLLTVTGESRPGTETPDFFFFAHHAIDLEDETRHFTLTAGDIALINPNTRTCPIFRTKRDSEIAKAIYRRVPILLKKGLTEENPWRISFQRMFDMSNDSNLFRSRDQMVADGFRLEGNNFRKNGEMFLPLYEAKMMYYFTHRYGDYEMRPKGSQDTELPRIPGERLADPNYVVMPNNWLNSNEVADALRSYNRRYILAFRNVSNATNERTAVFCLLPFAGIGNSAPVLLVERSTALMSLLYANLCSLVFDYVVRQKVGGTNLNFFYVEQFPVLLPTFYSRSHISFIEPRVLELTFTAWDMAAFGRDLGYFGPPFIWNEERRFMMRAELDALYFHLYSVSRKDAEYILDSFPIARRNDERRWGEYRSKVAILQIYDAIAEAASTGVPYRTPIDPAPADPRAAHLPSTSYSPLPIPLVPGHAGLLDALKLIPDNAWATPSGVTADNTALLALIDVLRQFSQPADSQHVRVAALLVRKPALALAFLGNLEKREWQRIVGIDAQPLPKNVIDISEFQHNVPDEPWTAAFNQLSGSNALITKSGIWSAGPTFPIASVEEWISGRAAVAVHLAAELVGDQARERMDRFLRSVRDATA